MKALGKVEKDDEQPKPREIDKAALKIRDDRAVLTLDEQPMGLRKVDGTWRIDNIFNGTLDEKPRQLPGRALARLGRAAGAGEHEGLRGRVPHAGLRARL